MDGVSRIVLVTVVVQEGMVGTVWWYHHTVGGEAPFVVTMAIRIQRRRRVVAALDGPGEKKHG